MSRRRSCLGFRQGCKGQIFSSDLMVAIFIFIIILGEVLATWNILIDTSAKDTELKNMEIAVTTVVDTLVKTRGYPYDWNRTGARVVGLADWDRTIDQKKLDEFMAMDYNLSKQAMGIGDFDYQFRLSKNNIVRGSVGGDTALIVRRVVFYNGVDIVEFTLW